MKEADWLGADDPCPLLEHLGRCRWMGTSSHASEGRKLRLALAACCRRVWGWLGPAGRDAVGEAEEYADGRRTERDLARAAQAAAVEAGQSDQFSAGNRANWAASWVCQGLHHPDQVLRACAVSAGYAAASYDDCLAEINARGGVMGEISPALRPDSGPVSAAWRVAYDAERAAQADLVREVFNPFLPRLVRPEEEMGYPPGKHFRVPLAWLAWGGGTVPRLAERVYAGRDWAALPVLADALEEAGCDSAELLGHLRGPGPHARGCWAADLIMGKD